MTKTLPQVLVDLGYCDNKDLAKCRSTDIGRELVDQGKISIQQLDIARRQIGVINPNRKQRDERKQRLRDLTKTFDRLTEISKKVVANGD